MKKKLLAILAGLFMAFFANAQYATIPDSSFVNWLRNNGYSDCMVGNQIDTNCTYVLNAHSLNCFAQPIHNLTGVQYFKNLDSLDCSNDSISVMPALPNQLAFFNCSYNQLSSLPSLPATLTGLKCTNNSLDSLPALKNINHLDCSHNLLTRLPVLPGGLNTLVCMYNSLSGLPSLPSALQILQCDYNYIDSLPTLPLTLQMLHCSSNSLGSVPALPSTLVNFDCQINTLSSLPALPEGLMFLWCGSNQLDSLPTLPSTLQQLDCTSGSLKSLPALPASVYNLYCARNILDSLPALPSTLQKLYCDHNHITHLPAFPTGLTIIYCSNNNLSALPAIPGTVRNLLCDHNSLGSLPELPDSLNVLQCSSNTNLYCLPQLKKINTLYFDNTNITCLPDYGSVLNSYPALNTLPLCGEGGSSSCGAFWNISGKAYYDANNNCVFDAGDSVQANIKVMLYDSNSLVAQTYTGGDGYFSFKMNTHGTYYLVVDTGVLPFRVSCPSYGSRTVVISSTDSIAYSQDFALSCRNTGFDLGVSSIINEHYTARPAAIIPIVTTAGDMSKNLGANCSTGVGGVVKLVLSGPARYYGGLPSSLAPTTQDGDTLTWTVSNFGEIVNNKAFGINIVIDSTAQAGTTIGVNVTITPGAAGDYNPSNNSLSYSFNVVSSLDPNTKEVFPTGDSITPQDWLTYTVRFQNTGSAIAQNIVVLDTLDAGLDASTFQALASSSPYTVQVSGSGVVRFTFSSINLPDSLIDPTGSHAYIQYKVLPKSGIAPGTYIQNTAYIYFDYNAPMATNTTVNRMAITPPPSKVTDVTTLKNQVDLSLFPNPASHLLTVMVDNTAIGGTLSLLNTTGQQIFELEVRTQQFTVPVSTLANGIYFVKVTTGKGHFNMKKLVIQR